MKRMNALNFRRFFKTIVGLIAALALLTLALLITASVMREKSVEIAAAIFFSALGLLFTLFVLTNYKRFRQLEYEYESVFGNDNAVDGTVELPITHVQFFAGNPVLQGTGGVRMNKEGIELLDDDGKTQNRYAWSEFLYAKVALYIVPQIFLSHEPICLENHNLPTEGFTGIAILASPDALKGVELFGGIKPDESLIEKIRAAVNDIYTEGKNKLLYAFMGMFGLLATGVCVGLSFALIHFGLPLAAVLPLAEVPCMAAVFLLSEKLFGQISRDKYFLSDAGLTYTHGMTHETIFFERLTSLRVTNGVAIFESRLVGTDGTVYDNSAKFPISKSLLHRIMAHKQKKELNFIVELGAEG